MAVAYLLLDPHTGDHAAAVYRAGLFEREGFSLWDNNWYSGHHIPAYSVLYPPLAALVGVRVAGALAAVAAAALFEKLTDNKVSAQWFALGTATLLVTGRMPFLLGVAFAVAAMLPAIVLSVAFPEGGSFPFEPSSFWPQLAGTLFVLFLITYRQDTNLKRDPLVVGTVLYAFVLIAAFAVESPMGGNAVRLGALASGPVVAAVLWPDRKWLLAAAALPLLFWQWNAPVDNLLRTHGDESVHEGYYDELNRELARRNAKRIEIPFTENHWETAYVAPETALARGWERQLDRKYNGLFYEDSLTPEKYAQWINDTAVDYVAVPDAPLDYSARDEAKVIAAGVPGLERVWRGNHWTLYRVAKTRLLAKGEGLAIAKTDTVEVRAFGPGTIDLRVRWTPYWRISEGHGCVEKHGQWTRIRASKTGPMTLSTHFASSRIGATSPRCSGG